MKVESFSIRSGGATIAGTVFGAGPPLLAVHALAFSSRYFSRAAEQLGRSFRVVAIDQRGHGLTRVDATEPASRAEGSDELQRELAAPAQRYGMTPEQMSADLLAVLDAFGWEQASVGGISLGAATTLRLALDHPRRVTRLMQDLPAFGPDSPRGIGNHAAVTEALRRGALEEAADRVGDGLSPPRAKALGAALIEAWAGYEPTELGPKLDAIFRASAGWRISHDWPNELARLRVPVEILALPGDRSHPIAVAQQMAAALPQARIHHRVPSLEPLQVAEQWISLLS